MANNPTLFNVPLASSSTKNNIFTNTGTGALTVAGGFPTETMQPTASGGVAPSGKDFNGMMYAVGEHLFKIQKGFTWNYDATQDYYAGCKVMDTDGKIYICIADMTAGTVAPHSDTTNTYWLNAQNYYGSAMFNTRVVMTSSGTFTVPVTGWYKITAKGGGGGGGGSTVVSSFIKNGGGGGEGGTYIGYHKLTAGDTIACVVGAGGTGGTTVSSGSQQSGANGGDSTVTIAGTIFTASGGVGSSFSGGTGGLGTIIGCPGTTGTLIQSSSAMRYGCCGGGAGGQNGPGRTGAGGGGGNYYSSTDKTNGYNGGSGYIWFEYFDPSL